MINDDVVSPGTGFGMHGHSDMEIITYILQGELQHRDSLGNGSIIRRGDVQRMSAGTGIRHSEFNPSTSETVHLLQIWLLPAQRGITPGYEQKTFADAEKRGKLRLVASRDGRDGSVMLYQYISLYATILEQDDTVSRRVEPGRCAYLHVAQGALQVNGQALRTGDAAKITNENEIVLSDANQAEVLLFDLPIIEGDKP